MAENSKIEWCDNTFNPWRGCSRVSQGCQNCYAEALSLRNPATLGKWGAGGTRVVAVPSYWAQAHKWDRDVLLAKHQPCGCVVCTCEDEEQCHGCGAKNCGDHPVGKMPNPVYIRPRVFCSSLADVFEDWGGPMVYPDKNGPDGVSPVWWDNTVGMVPKGKTGERLATMDDVRLHLFETIRTTPYLDWLLLTKRPQNWAKCIEGVLKLIESLPDWDTPGTHRWEPLRDWLADWFVLHEPPANVWIGTTVEDQERADKRIPQLLQIPAKVRFLSCEPLLGPVDLRFECDDPDDDNPAGKIFRNALAPGFGIKPIHWVICGGESGPKARPMHPDWARSLRDQCAAAGVPFLFKQWGEYCPAEGRPESLTHIHRWPDNTAMVRPGKKAAGRLLDGQEHNGFPQP